MLLALKVLLYTYCLAILTIWTSVRQCNWAGRGAGSGTVAKQAIEMSLLVMLNILKPEEHLTTEYVKTNVVALLFWSHWHSSSLGCIHSEELGESLHSQFSAHCCRNTACTSMQQSSHLFCLYNVERKCYAVCSLSGAVCQPFYHKCEIVHCDSPYTVHAHMCSHSRLLS